MPCQLAIDIGGTKTLAALVDGKAIIAEREMPTPREHAARQWCMAVEDLVRELKGEFTEAGVAVTGLIEGGKWSALNPATLPIPDQFPLEHELEQCLKVPVGAFNDAQAAAWGEYRFGAGQGRDLFYITISTGIGGGAIVHGRRLSGRNGLAGSAGQLRVKTADGIQRIEDIVSGLWIGAEARRRGHDYSAKDVFEAARTGEAWAENIISQSAAMASLLFQNIQLLFAPEVIVTGGSIGLAGGYLERIRSLLSELPGIERPLILASALGRHAGVVGAADLVRSLNKNRGGKT